LHIFLNLSRLRIKKISVDWDIDTPYVYILVNCTCFARPVEFFFYCAGHYLTLRIHHLIDLKIINCRVFRSGVATTLENSGFAWLATFAILCMYCSNLSSKQTMRKYLSVNIDLSLHSTACVSFVDYYLYFPKDALNYHQLPSCMKRSGKICARFFHMKRSKKDISITC
jgi:hypothetical protein